MAEPAFTAITYAVEDAIATITLARPNRLNAFNGTMLRDILAAMDVSDADDAVRAVIVTGAGRAFSAGADLSRGTDSFVDPAGAPPTTAGGAIDYASEQARDGGGLLSLRLYRMLKPVIGAINGAAVGLGATFTLPMDIRLASETARFGFVFARRGMVPEAASAFFLPRLVGISRAIEWCCAGRLVDAHEAMEAGLVRAVLPPDDLLPAARKMAQDMTRESAPVSIALTRQMLWRGLGMTHPMEAHRVDSRGIVARGRSADVAEGVASFLEKRPPSFPEPVSTGMPDYFPWWEEPPYA